MCKSRSEIRQPLWRERQTETDGFEWDKRDGGIYHATAHTPSSESPPR